MATDADCEMNKTIDYYNTNAEEYFKSTSQANVELLYNEFGKHLPAGGRIMDLGCGSGRDVKWFREHGYAARGLDASEKLVQIAQARFDIPVEVGCIEDWISEEPFDGIWCCAALMHLTDSKAKRFVSNLSHNLKSGGAIFVSVKTGIETGYDSAGRYLKDFTEHDIYTLLENVTDVHIKELWYTNDSLNRSVFKWLNVIAVRE